MRGPMGGQREERAIELRQETERSGQKRRRRATKIKRHKISGKNVPSLPGLVSSDAGEKVENNEISTVMTNLIHQTRNKLANSSRSRVIHHAHTVIIK